MKRLLLISIALFGFSYLYGNDDVVEVERKAPNILFLFADDQRSSTLKNPEIIKPHLEQLLKKGVFFSNAHIMGADNGAVCAPSRAMLITSKRLSSLQPKGFEISSDHVLLGETLQKAGYDTYGIGKWHNTRSEFNRNFNGGEAIFMGGMHDHWNVPLFHYKDDAVYKNSRPHIEDFFNANKIDSLPGDYTYSGKHSTEIFADAAIDYLNQKHKKPFFLYVSFMSPHDPRTTPKEILDKYDASKLSMPPNFKEKHPFDNGELIIRDEQLAATPRVPKEVKEHIKDYYSMITHLDENIGRILETLEKNGLSKNTIIVFAADNGLAMGQHGLMGKQNLYQHSVNVPLIISGKGIPKGETRSTFCYLTDLFPTLCELTETTVPQNLDGKSLVPAINDDTKIRNALYFQYKDVQSAIRKDNYKLIKYEVKGQQTIQLFDLEKDPWELNNLADSLPEVVSSLLKEFEKWDADYGLSSRKN
ncbi:sulfatase-like hydrolase/transferase [Chondrinema litorale]|uniref:sulfatase-like hydrolase/transferase n=1 Tax=Chondrinema litorale TaxID=2994555 RepID=UPI00254390F6|nr:sulfatase-like hydrolase/transferase [Chondrinema litorale]UZR97888.1 sulfatase-like hydrolase/transferase [Chondrinema litorale]